MCCWKSVRILSIAGIILTLAVAECWAAEPTLARLSFWVPPERMAEFEAAYRDKVVPILRKHGLAESLQRGRVTVDSVFSRLIRLKTPADLEKKAKAFWEDPVYQEVAKSLGAVFGSPHADGRIRSTFSIYSTPSLSGKVVPAGREKGQWRTYDMSDGLAGETVGSIFQDRQGHLWIGTDGGLNRYDGQVWTTFTTADRQAGDRTDFGFDSIVQGITELGGTITGEKIKTTSMEWHQFLIFQDKKGHLWVGGTWELSRYDGQNWKTFPEARGAGSIVQDREGNLWFSTWGNWVKRYDGQTWTTFTTKDGLRHNKVRSILQDRKGDLWFGTMTGLSRYDGQNWVTFTPADGLGGYNVETLLEDRQGCLWVYTFGGPGVSGGLSRYDGQHWTTFTEEDGLANGYVQSFLQDRQGYLWFGTSDNGVNRYDGKAWTTFTTKDGLAANQVTSIFQDQEGDIWFGTQGGGVSRYDGQTWTTFTTKDGLAANEVLSILQGQEGYLWFGTEAGLSRYDKSFTTYTPKDGLAGVNVSSILQDRKGHLWFGTGDGLSRYDERTWQTFTIRDGLAGNAVSSILQDRQGRLWIGTDGGLNCYDGRVWTTFSREDGLADNFVASILEDRAGHLWFGTWGKGASRYDGQRWTTCTKEDGLAGNFVASILEDREGHLWFGTTDGGISLYDGESFSPVAGNAVSRLRLPSVLQDRKGHLWFGGTEGVIRYDGKTWVTLKTEDDLEHHPKEPIFQDREGHIWFGTGTLIFGGGRGAIRYDGRTFQTLARQDGLASNNVLSVLQDQEGDLWFGTTGGLTCYHQPSSSPPAVFIDAVVADRRYGRGENISIPSNVKVIDFEFRAISFKTRPETMVYRYRLKGYDDSWLTTHVRRVEYQDLPRGTYTFEVEGVDRDLVYSVSPATAQVRVHLYLPYEQIGWISALSVIILLLVLQTARVVRRGRNLKEAQQQLMESMLKELQTAHDMQMNLMPMEHPRLRGFDVAGRCIPADHVGGDFFQYFDQGDKLILTLADVTGHAMEAAIPVVMFSGILETQMEQGGSVEDLFDRLNRSLNRTLGRRTFVCFTMGELDPLTRILRFSNGGCPSPLHFQATTGEIMELEVGAYPLGVRPDIHYEVLEVRLQPGDRIVFCSDGIVEADNAEGEQFGFEQTAETIRNACQEGLPAEATIDRLLEKVSTFKGNAQQSDDMTCVVVRMEE